MFGIANKHPILRVLCPPIMESFGIDVARKTVLLALG